MADKVKIVTIRHTTEKGSTVDVYKGPVKSDKPQPWALRNTEEKYQTLEQRLRRFYREAQQDLMMKQMDFLQRHEKRVEKYSRQVEAGLLTKQDFQAWMRGQLFQERQWELKRGQLARMMVNVDKTAMAMVNEGKMEIFADNADHMLFRIEQDAGVTTPFGLFNQDAVVRLIRDQPNLLPMSEVDEGKDYKYYNEVMQNAVIQGILQGETLDEIAKRVADDTGEKAFNTLRRNARTAYTGAQNAGALLSMRRARDQLGLKLKKRWMATLDGHTRDAHADLDGQVRDLDEPFDSLLGPIWYPGDLSADPANVWNCRCWMDEFYPESNNTMYRWDDEEGEYVGDVTYREWRRMKGAA